MEKTQLKSRPLSLTHNGRTLEGVIVTPTDSGPPRPAVLVAHDAMGRGPLYLEKAHQVAELGYIGIAIDMYGDGFHSKTTDEAGEHFVQFHSAPSLIRERMLAWYDIVNSLTEVDKDRIAALGYCFGGQCVLELARAGADIKAVVSYHGLLTTHAPATPGSIRGVVAVYTGSKDPYVPHEHVRALQEEMTAVDADLHLTEFSSAYHSFTNPAPARGVEAGMQYSALCDRVSWAGTVALLAETLAGPE